MRHRDHDISLLVPLLNVLEGFRDLLELRTSIDDRLELPCRGKVCDEIHSFAFPLPLRPCVSYPRQWTSKRSARGALASVGSDETWSRRRCQISGCRFVHSR